jgi:hypothetical protein
MDLLRNDGYTIIETLVSFVILGLFVTFTVGIYISLFHNPNLVLKSEALLAASREMECAINNRSLSDTTFLNENNNLKIFRKVSKGENIYKIDIFVFFKADTTMLLNLSAYLNEFNGEK